MKKILAFALPIILFLLLPSINISAVVIEFSYYDSEFTINKDSTVTVKEKIGYELTGDAHGIRRDIVLFDKANNDLCEASFEQTCGNLSIVEIISASTSESNDTLRTFNYEDNGSKFLRIENELWSEGKEVANYPIELNIEYKMYGAINHTKEGSKLYINLLPNDRAGLIRNSSLNINFPSNVRFNKDELEVFTDSPAASSAVSNNTFSLKYKNLSTSKNVTMAYTFAEGEIIAPGSIKYSVDHPFDNLNIKLNNIELGSVNPQEIKFIPAGKHLLTIEHQFFNPKIIEINLKEGEQFVIDGITLERTWLGNFISITLALFQTIGLPGILLAIFLPIKNYVDNGRDFKLLNPIIPIFDKPIENLFIAETLLKEEISHKAFIATIIDLNYKKIITIEKEHLILNQKLGDISDLSRQASEIINLIFESSQKVLTKEVFLGKIYADIKATSLDESTTLGYFHTNPTHIKSIEITKGVLTLVFGILTAVLFSYLYLMVNDSFTNPLISIGFVIFGILTIIFANYMPSKTKSGVELQHRILGFKMFLETADKYIIKKLTPDDFYKNLGFAFLLGIENIWAKQFESIISIDEIKAINDSLIIYHGFSSGYVNSYTHHLTQAAVNSNSSWGNSSGSFSGFSGGGAGGGSAGGW